MTEKFDLEDLKQFMPEASMKTLAEYDVFVLKNNITVGKFVKSEALTSEEKHLFAERLNDEWVKTAIDPYYEALYKFCQKYEIAPIMIDVSLTAMPMMKFMLDTMVKDAIGGKNIFNFDED